MQEQKHKEQHRNYTTDSAEAMDDISKFKAKMHIEYEYNGKS